MPYARNSELPPGVRNALPDAAQTRFREVFNGRKKAGDDDQRAFREAWHVVGVGWKKPAGGGKWIRKSEMPEFLKADVCKVDQELGLVFGWGIVCKVNGEPYFDLQNDHIPEDAMLKATAEFMQNSRITTDMHACDADGAPIPDGGVVFSFPLTTEIAKALGIEADKTGWLVAVRPGPDVLAKYKSGEYSGFSIGGRRIEDEDVE